MFKFVSHLTLLVSICFSLNVSALERNVEEMLKKADHYRLQEDASKVVSKVELYENAELDKTRLYHVYLRENRESLVVFKSQVEAGQKMLMLGDNYWLLMPKSRRPIRITPMQKLLGEASVGDISTLTWSDDYKGSWIKRDVVTLESGAQIETHLLELEAVTKGASYARIELWLEKSTDFPVKANLYLRSGKMAKEAWFERGERDGKLSVSAMLLIDKIQPSKKTRVEYGSIEPTRLEDKYYNPAYLSRNTLSEL